MNLERLEELKKRAERGVWLAAEIERLNEANPFAVGTSVAIRDNRMGAGEDLLPSRTLRECIDLGRKQLIARHEQELESLLRVIDGANWQTVGVAESREIVGTLVSDAVDVPQDAE